jgi:predicted RNase H-like nuclease (RuvC/YqgF family)
MQVTISDPVAYQAEHDRLRESTWVVRRARYLEQSKVIEADRKVARATMDAGITHMEKTIEGYQNQIKSLLEGIEQAKAVIEWQKNRLAQIDIPFDEQDQDVRKQFRIDEIPAGLMGR